MNFQEILLRSFSKIKFLYESAHTHKCMTMLQFRGKFVFKGNGEG